MAAERSGLNTGAVALAAVALASRPGGRKGLRAGSLDQQLLAGDQRFAVPAEYLDRPVRHALDEDHPAIAAEGRGFRPAADRRLRQLAQGLAFDGIETQQAVIVVEGMRRRLGAAVLRPDGQVTPVRGELQWFRSAGNAERADGAVRLRPQVDQADRVLITVAPAHVGYCRQRMRHVD